MARLAPERGAGTAPARIATAPIAAGGLIAGFGVAVVSGSRPLGGVVLAAAGLSCIAIWRRRDRPAVTAGLTVTGLAAFALSHLLADAIGAWPSVFTAAAVTAAACWRFSDRHRPRALAATAAPAAE